MIINEFPTKLILFRTCDVIIWIIPPALPIFLNICLILSLIRLKYKDVLGKYKKI
jgi:magnesium-transporting ATPase (P-type)